MDTLLAIFFIAGTTIGISFLTIPIITGIAGFFPGVLISVIVWLFMFALGLLYAEATLATPTGSNFTSITRRLLGPIWSVIAAVIFAICLLSYLTSYFILGPPALSYLTDYFFHLKLSLFWSNALLFIIFGCVLLWGVSAAVRLNFILLVSFFVAFLFILYQGKGEVQPHRLLVSNWVYIFFSIPILFSALGYAAVIPSVTTYLKRDTAKIKKAIFFGSFIPLIVYLFWQWLVIGATEKGLIWVAYEERSTITEALPWLQAHPLLVLLINFVIFFAITTSLLGVGIAMIDFLADTFGFTLEKRKGWIRLCLTLLTLLPAVFLAPLIGPYILKLLEFFITPMGEVMIYGIIPYLLVIEARYIHKLDTPHLLPGGKIMLASLGIAIFFLIYFDGIQMIKER